MSWLTLTPEVMLDRLFWGDWPEIIIFGNLEVFSKKERKLFDVFASLQTVGICPFTVYKTGSLFFFSPRCMMMWDKHWKSCVHVCSSEKFLQKLLDVQSRARKKFEKSYFCKVLDREKLMLHIWPKILIYLYFLFWT